MSSNIEIIATKTSEKDFELKKPDCRRVPRSFMTLLRSTPPQKMPKLWKVQNSYNYHSLEIRMIDAYLKKDGTTKMHLPAEVKVLPIESSQNLPIMRNTEKQNGWRSEVCETREITLWNQPIFKKQSKFNCKFNEKMATKAIPNEKRWDKFSDFDDDSRNPIKHTIVRQDAHVWQDETEYLNTCEVQRRTKEKYEFISNDDSRDATKYSIIRQDACIWKDEEDCLNTFRFQQQKYKRIRDQ